MRAWPLAYLQGIVHGTSRTNGRQFAEYAGEARPDGMQRLLSSAIWEFDLVRDDLRSYVLEQLSDLQAILVIDETSFPKRGCKSAGVQMQYCETRMTKSWLVPQLAYRVYFLKAPIYGMY